VDLRSAIGFPYFANVAWQITTIHLNFLKLLL